jgi:putative flippase GtrA
MVSTSLFRRWAAFNLVGAAGMAVQLGALAALVHAAAWPTALATAAAVELAVIHNFWWHERWTWRDRPSASAPALLARFWRFQAVNGLISLAGNVAITTAVSRFLGVDPVAANLLAIGLCSFLTFAAGEKLVFVAPAVLAALVLAPVPATAGPRPGTVAAWEEHQRQVDARYHASRADGGRFFAQDHDAAGQAGWRGRALGGEVTIARIDAPATPEGRIHHWAGAIFLPGLTVDRVMERLKQQAGREADVYTDVLDSRLLSRDGDRLRVYMKLQRTTVITATFHTEHAVEYRRLGPARGSSRSVATRIAELDDAGTAREREKRPEDDNGFLWRLNAYWRFEAVDGGVLLECESVSLSRAVPSLLKPIANPIVDRVAREALQNTLREMRQFLGGQGRKL